MSSSQTITIRRRLTDGPLARRHEHALARRAHARAVVNIPWRGFDRGLYPEPALALAHDAQRMLATGEYTAVDLFARVASALALHGAPFDVVAAAAAVPADEIRHADYALRLASLYAGHEAEIQIDRTQLEAHWRQPLGQDALDRVMCETVAVGETLAAALLSACRSRANDPLARAVFGSLVADEVHHARVGWYYLAWRAPQWTRPERQRVADGVGAMVAGIEARFWHGRDAPRGSRRAAGALGVLDSVTQRRAIRAVTEDELVPALDALGLGASHAWRVRRRGGSAP